MKRILYDKKNSIKKYTFLDLNKVYNSSEHEKISKLELEENKLKNKENLIKYSLNRNLRNKFPAFLLLLDRINKKNYCNILSLGSGLTDIEYFLYLSLNKNNTIIASEFNRYFIEKSNDFFPEFKTIEFDLFKDSLLEKNYNFDLVYSFGSFCVMDDIQFVRLLKDIKNSGVQEIIDFHAGFMTKQEVYKVLIKELFSKFTNFLNKDTDIFKGKFYGFRRDKKELFKIYRQSGWNPVKEIKNIGGYKVAFILN